MTSDDELQLTTYLHLMTTKWIPLQQFVTNLILLQGSNLVPSPPWLHKFCGRQLSKCLLQKNALLPIISVVAALRKSGLFDFRGPPRFRPILKIIYPIEHFLWSRIHVHIRFAENAGHKSNNRRAGRGTSRKLPTGHFLNGIWHSRKISNQRF